MAGIVCAIRGGPASQPTIQKAIELAKDTHLVVNFLYIVNLDFLERSATSRVHMISEEMRQMGDFILLVAQSQAGDQGVESKGLVRDGVVSEEIIQLCKEIQADYVILGSPQGESEENVFTHARLKLFGQLIQSSSGAKPIFLGSEEE